MFGHNFSNILVGCWHKWFETHILIFVYAQIVGVIKYRAAEKVIETVDEGEVDYSVTSNHAQLSWVLVHSPCLI
jgi:hypothetical protein